MTAKAGRKGRSKAGTEPVPARQRILIRDITLSCIVGVGEDERARPQRLRLNLAVELAPKVPRNDDVSEVLNYARVVKLVRDICLREQCRLLETLAARIAEACFTFNEVTALMVRIEKLDRYAFIAGIGIEMEYHRPTSGAGR